jgi:hypothetical protein
LFSRGGSIIFRQDFDWHDVFRAPFGLFGRAQHTHRVEVFLLMQKQRPDFFSELQGASWTCDSPLERASSLT